MAQELWGDETGVLELPDGRRVRGRSYRKAADGGQDPTFGLYLAGRPPPAVDWRSTWLRWPDFWLPTDRREAARAIEDVFERCATERVEVACGGGVGRTGTVLSCLCVLAGSNPSDAITYVREHYQRRAVETPWQRRFVRTFRR